MFWFITPNKIAINAINGPDTPYIEFEKLTKFSKLVLY